MEPTNQGEAPKLSQVIQIDEGKIQEHLGEVVRSTVEETLNAMLDAEADRLCRAERYVRTEARKDTRAGSYQRHLQTKAGEVTLKVPKLRTLPFETAIIERYRRRESSVEEALVEMYLAGVSVRRVEDITEALWGTRVSPSTVSELNQKIYAQIESWRNRPIEGKHPYVFLDGLWLKRSWGGEVRNAKCGEEPERWSISGWEIGTDASRGKVASCGRREMGHAALPGHEPTSGSERSGAESKSTITGGLSYKLSCVPNRVRRVFRSFSS